MTRVLRGASWVVLGGAVTVLGRRAMDFDSYWFDESGQYWMAQGQTHYAGPGTPAGGLSDILAANAAANLDPGGFTLLLRLWSELLPVALLRLLPLLFGLLAVVLAVILVRTVSNSTIGIAALAGSIVLLSPLLHEYSFELRAYTMEAASTLLAALLVAMPPRFWTSWVRTSVAGLGLSVLATSRYSALVPAALAVVMIGLDRRIGLPRRVALATLVAPAGLFSVWMLLRQNPSARPPTYVEGLLGSSPRSLLGAVLHPESVWLFLALGAVILLVARSEGGSGVRWMQPLGRFATFSMAVCTAFVMLSLLGFYPFGARTRWDITIQALLFTVAAVLAADVLDRARIPDGPAVRAGGAILIALGLILGFMPVTKERMVEAMVACFDPAAPLVLNEGALATFRIHREALGSLEILGSSTPLFYADHSTPGEGASGQPSHLIEFTEVPGDAQVLLNRPRAEDLELLARSRSFCFGDLESGDVFLIPASSVGDTR